MSAPQNFNRKAGFVRFRVTERARLHDDIIEALSLLMLAERIDAELAQVIIKHRDVTRAARTHMRRANERLTAAEYEAPTPVVEREMVAS